MSAPGDRRSHLRYAVVGHLWGSLEALESLPVLDLSPYGAGVASPRPLPLGAVSSARLVLAGFVTDLHLRVRHSHVEAEGERLSHILGFEFIGLAPEAAGRLADLLALPAVPRPEAAQGGR